MIAAACCLTPRAAAAERAVSPSAKATADGCLAATVCSLRRRVSPRDPAWTPEFCRVLAAGILSSAQRHQLSPALLLAVMINESDLDEKVYRVSHARGKVARDSGLMGIRCVMDGRGRCTNALVRGLAWRRVMDPVTNVELGARYLAHYRDGAGRSLVTIRRRDPSGTIRTTTRSVPCRHRDHAYWAHYNHGTRFIAGGAARFYPHHVAILYAAVAEAMAAPPLADRSLARYTLAGLARADHRARRYFDLTRAIGKGDPICTAPATFAAR